MVERIFLSHLPPLFRDPHPHPPLRLHYTLGESKPPRRVRSPCACDQFGRLPIKSPNTSPVHPPRSKPGAQAEHCGFGTSVRVYPQGVRGQVRASGVSGPAPDLSPQPDGMGSGYTPWINADGAPSSALMSVKSPTQARRIALLRSFSAILSM